MSAKQQPSLTELRVGIFVVVACAVLAMAIFAIGSQVGLFEDQFVAVTYLSNVSGLKPGDVVLLGGVEVGNVATVTISEADDLPETTRNTQILQSVSIMLDRAETLEDRMVELEEALQNARREYETAVEAQAPEDRINQLQARVEETTDNLEEVRDRLQDLQREIDRERSGLQNIEVRMRVNAEYRDWIKADSSISLGSIGLLGDKYIEISLGRTERPPRTVTMEFDSWLGKETREVVLITGVQQASFAELITGANDILANFETLSDQVEDIMRSFEAGEGTIGRFLTDPSFYNNLNETVENANRATEQIADLVGDMGMGEGTVSKLVRDDILHQRMVGATENLESLLHRIEHGEGTLGQLVRDPSVFQKTDEVLASLEAVLERVETGQGTLGRLSTEDELYVSLRESTEELAAILEDIQAGEGTLGRLAKDEQLYQNMNEVSTEVVKLLYDFRQDPEKFLTIKFELF